MNSTSGVSHPAIISAIEGTFTIDYSRLIIDANQELGFHCNTSPDFGRAQIVDFS